MVVGARCCYKSFLYISPSNPHNIAVRWHKDYHLYVTDKKMWHGGVQLCTIGHSLEEEGAGFEMRQLSTRVHTQNHSVHSPSLQLSKVGTQERLFCVTKRLSGWMSQCYNSSKLSSELLQDLIFDPLRTVIRPRDYELCSGVGSLGLRPASDINYAPWTVPLTSKSLFLDLWNGSDNAYFSE